MEPVPYVPQRSGSRGDCVVATLATITGLSYEQMAALLGFETDHIGCGLFEAVFPLLTAGFSASLLFPADVGHRYAPTCANGLAPRKAINAFLAERSALLFLHTTAGEHAVAWHHGRLIDGRYGVVGDTLDGVMFEAALLVSPLPASNAVGERPEPTLLLREAA